MNEYQIPQYLPPYVTTVSWVGSDPDHPKHVQVAVGVQPGETTIAQVLYGGAEMAGVIGAAVRSEMARYPGPLSDRQMGVAIVDALVVASPFEALWCDLGRDGMDTLIRVLQEARLKAYGEDIEVCDGGPDRNEEGLHAELKKPPVRMTEWVDCNETCLGRVAVETGAPVVGYHGSRDYRSATTRTRNGMDGGLVIANADGQIEVQK
jgi:hypothetical protein